MAISLAVVGSRAGKTARYRRQTASGGAVSRREPSPTLAALLPACRETYLAWGSPSWTCLRFRPGTGGADVTDVCTAGGRRCEGKHSKEERRFRSGVLALTCHITQGSRLQLHASGRQVSFFRGAWPGLLPRNRQRFSVSISSTIRFSEPVKSHSVARELDRFETAANTYGFSAIHGKEERSFHTSARALLWAAVSSTVENKRLGLLRVAHAQHRRFVPAIRNRPRASWFFRMLT